MALGVSIYGESSRKLGIKKRVVKFANFHVLCETILYCLYMLIEIGFITNINEEKRIIF
ncbi:MAG: N-acetylmuramoyl-L-alanine amidase [Flavobacteriaceae bacterium]|nr:N-acetylmuramoyl-L-alanine amidase [Flavobacteriaceae bacterium]